MRSFTASNSRPRLSAALALFAAAGIALPTATADITTTVDAREGPSRNSLTKVPLAPGSIASSVTCRAKIPNPGGKAIGYLLKVAKLDLQYTAGGGDFSLGLNARMDTDPDKFAANVLSQLASVVIPLDPSIKCDTTYVQDFGRIGGNIGLYSFAIGSFFGDATFIRTASATINFSDELVITSPSAVTIEMPLHVSGTVWAAEGGFGDNAVTKGIARLKMSGSLGGAGFSETAEVESVDFVPAEQVINVTRVVTVNLVPGVNRIPINVTGEAFGDATAKSNGFFAGACTLGVDFPNTIQIGRFRGVGNTPLPEGIVIASDETGRVIQSSNTTPCFAFSQEPQSRSACAGTSTSFSVVPSGTGPFTYEWERNGVRLDVAEHPTAKSATFVLNAVAAADAGDYACVVSDLCGYVQSTPATLTVCAADFNCDGFITFEDFDTFVGEFQSGGATADFDGDGFITFEDFDAFVGAFETGC